VASATASMISSPFHGSTRFQEVWDRSVLNCVYSSVNSLRSSSGVCANGDRPLPLVVPRRFGAPEH